MLPIHAGTNTSLTAVFVASVYVRARCSACARVGGRAGSEITASSGAKSAQPREETQHPWKLSEREGRGRRAWGGAEVRIYLCECHDCDALLTRTVPSPAS